MHQNKASSIISNFDKKYVENFLCIFLGAAIYSSDEDDSDFDTRRSKKPDKNKVLRALADSDEESDVSNRNAGSDNESNDDAKSGTPTGSGSASGD